MLPPRLQIFHTEVKGRHGSPLLFYAGSYGEMTNEHPAETLGWMGL